MAIIVPSVNPNQPIPNNPFYSDPSNYVQGATGPLIIGSGLLVDEATGILSATGGGGGAVSQILGGTGITINPAGGTGVVTVSLTTPPVTSVSATTPLSSTGGVTPTISLLNTGVAPGTYNNANITVDSFGRITSAASGVSGTVTSVDTGTGLSGGPITSSGTISLANTAVTPGSYTAANITVDAQGRITAASNSLAILSSLFANKGDLISATSASNPAVLPVGTAGQVLTADATASTGLKWTTLPPDGVTDVTGTAPIVSSGGSTPDISLANSGVSAGVYPYASVTVDAKGLVSFAAAGVAPNTTVTSPVTNTGTAVEPVIGVQTATTGQLGAVQVGTNIDVAAGVISVASSSTTLAGIVQLNDTVASTSITEALTANQGKVLQDQISSLLAAGGLTLAGTFDASTSQLLTVTTLGSGAGFTVGSNLPAPAAGNTDFFVIVTAGGSYSPPGGGGPFSASQGDWFLSDGAAYQYLNVGVDLPIASTGTAGIVELADSAETQAGTSTALAVTPAGAAATYLQIAELAAKGDIITATGANTPAALSIGADGEVLTACGASPTGLCWAPATTPAIPCACITGKGALVTGTAPDTPTTLSVGTDGQFLVADSTCATGLKWDTNTALTCALLTAKGTLVTATAASTPSSLAVGANGTILTACDTCTDGIAWITNAAIPCANLLDKGALISASAAGTPANLAVGNDGELLLADSTCTAGIKWGSLDLLAATPTSYGTLLGCTTADNTALGCNALVGVAAGVCNVALGTDALCATTDGNLNTALGLGAGSNITTGSNNVALGPNVAVASPTADCQLALGFSATDNWLTGDCDKNIAPGAGILDCDAALGTAGQALTSTGTALKWDGPYVPICCYDALGAMVVACDINCPYTIAPAVADRYTLVSCASCPGGVFWSPTLSILGETAVGAINFFAGQTPPVGWLVADGSEISRTGYAALFDVIGTTYGAGDGSTTFNLPDMRGMFPRGWDEAGGTARGCDPGRAFGTTQAGMVGPHDHDLCYGASSNLTGNNCFFAAQCGFGGLKAIATACSIATDSVQPNTGTETRPVNVALLPCIKYENTAAPLSPSSGIPCSCITGKGALLTGNLACSPQALPIGVPGSLLMTNAGCALGIEWASPGVKGSVLLPNTTCATGLEWVAPATNGQILMACSTCNAGAVWQTGAVGPWISAGTVQSVGFTSTGTTPGYGTTSTNNISYRQIGPKEWQVVGTYFMTAAGTTGSGDYVFTLPNSLSFDTTLPFQQVYAPAVASVSFFYILPDSKVFSSTAGAGNYGGFQGGIVPRSATTYRIMGSTTSSSTFWSASFYALNDIRYMKWSFTFTST